jgi:hypothetical protein
MICSRTLGFFVLFTSELHDDIGPHLGLQSNEPFTGVHNWTACIKENQTSAYPYIVAYCWLSLSRPGSVGFCLLDCNLVIGPYVTQMELHYKVAILWSQTRGLGYA